MPPTWVAATTLASRSRSRRSTSVPVTALGSGVMICNVAGVSGRPDEEPEQAAPIGTSKQGDSRRGPMFAGSRRGHTRDPMVDNKTNVRYAPAVGRRPGGTTVDTKERLLDAAARVIVARGYEGARVSEIAAEAGLSTGAIYAHYEGKADLLCPRSTGGVRTAVEGLLDAGVAGTLASTLKFLGARLVSGGVTRRARIKGDVLIESHSRRAAGSRRSGRPAREHQRGRGAPHRADPPRSGLRRDRQRSPAREREPAVHASRARIDRHPTIDLPAPPADDWDAVMGAWSARCKPRRRHELARIPPGEMVSTETERRRRRWPFWVAASSCFIALGAGLYGGSSTATSRRPIYNVINYSVPARPTSLPARRDRLPHRPDAVELTYSTDEKLFGPGPARPRARRTASPATSRSTRRTRPRARSARSSSTSSSCTPTTTCATRCIRAANLDSHD